MLTSTASLLAFVTVIGQLGGVQAAALEPRACVVSSTHLLVSIGRLGTRWKAF